MKFIATKPTKYGHVIYQADQEFTVADKDIRVAREVFLAKPAPAAAPSAPVGKVADTKPPIHRHEPSPVRWAAPVSIEEPIETAELEADDDAPPVKRGGYQTRRLKAKD